MNKKIIIAIVVLVIIIFGVYLIWKNSIKNVTPVLAPTSENGGILPRNESSGNEEALNEEVVVFKDSGYSPASLTIKKGTTVVFKNESKLSNWTASAKHPTHTVYPTKGGCLGSTFDACKGITPGDSWSFKFDIVGTWGYHDHLHPTFFGKIIVEE